MKNNKPILNMVLTALFASLIAVFTAFLFHIPIKIGANTAYLHFGDAIIFLAASILPIPYSLAAAGIGGALGDLFCGGVEWIPFTIIIKIMIAFVFTSKSSKMLCKRNIFALFTALLITVGGYYMAEALIFGNWVSPLLSVWGNVVQIVGSAIVYTLICGTLGSRLKFK